MALDQREKALQFRGLHGGQPFLILNPWDVGSAKMLAALGSPALTTTSSGFAFTLGRRDGGATLDDVLLHTRAISDAVDVPLAVDLENGYGETPEAAAAAVVGAAAAGAVGGSIEDFDPVGGIYPLEQAVERVAAAADAARGLTFPFTLTARAENHFRGTPDLEDTIARLQAFEQAGADVLFAPGLSVDELRAVRVATTRPLNALASPGQDLAELFSAGAQRVSVGGALAWVAIGAAADAASGLLGGDLSVLESADARRIADLLT